MRILGLEYGSWSLKGVEVESKFRKLDILDYHEVKLPLELDDPVKVYRESVEKMMARLPVHPEKIVASLPPSQTSLRFLKTPVKQKSKVEKMFLFDLEDEVPFRLDKCIIEHKISKIPDGNSIFAAIAPTQYVQSHIDWLRSTGVDPDWLTFEGMGLINLYLNDLSAKKQLNDSGTVLLMDIGHLKTNLAFIHNGVLEFFRSIAWGGMSITQYIAQSQNCSLEEAEIHKMEGVNLEDPASSAAMPSILQSLNLFTADIQHSIVSYRTQYKRIPNQMLIAGGTSSMSGIEHYLEAQFRRPCHLLHFDMESKELTPSEERQKLRFGEAYGRANVFARSAQLLFNFRKGAMGKKTSLTEIGNFVKTPKFIKSVKYAAVLAIILLVHVILSTPAAKSEAKDRKKSIDKLFAVNFRNVPTKLRRSLLKDPNQLRKFLKARSSELDQKLKAVSQNRTPMLKLMLALSGSFPEDVKVDVNRLSLNDKRFEMEGVLYEGSLNKTKEIIQNIDSFEEINLSLNGQRFRFSGNVAGR